MRARTTALTATVIVIGATLLFAAYGAPGIPSASEYLDDWPGAWPDSGPTVKAEPELVPDTNLYPVGDTY